MRWTRCKQPYGSPRRRKRDKRRADRAETAAGHDVDLLHRLATPIGEDFAPAAPVVRSGGFRRPEACQMPGRARAIHVVRVVRGDHGDAERQLLKLGLAVTRATDEEGGGSIGEHHVESAPGGGIQRGDRPGSPGRGPMIQRQQRQFAPAALARRRSQRTGTVQHRRDDAMPVHPHPGAPGGAIPSRDGAGTVGPPGSRRVPRPIQPFIAIGGEQDMGGTNENHDGTHGRQDGVFLAIAPALERSGGDRGQACRIEPIEFAQFWRSGHSGARSFPHPDSVPGA
jgi:hypothetical protein